MQQRLLKFDDVLELVPVTKPTIYRWMRLGQFPKPIKIPSGTIFWKQSDIEKWIADGCYVPD